VSRFFNPFPQFFSSTPNVLSGAKLFFYAAGGSSKLDTFPTLADRIAGTNANSNPIVLNSSGYQPTDIHLKNQAYKIVLAPATDTDPPTSPIWSTDNYFGTDFSSVVETKVGSGAPTGVVAGTAASAGVLPTFYFDYTGSVLYVATTTGDAASAAWTAINASASTPAVPPPQGYLTLVSGTPIITSDQASKTAVYYTPFVGNLVPIYNGASMTPTEFSELTLTLVASHALSTIYDVFVWSESGVLTIGTGPAWTTSTAGSGARGTGSSTTELARVKGLLVNAVAITARNGNTTYSVGANLATYVGSLFIDGSAGQITCHRAVGQSRKWGVWNAYNQRLIILQVADSTASWTYDTATIRASRGQAVNSASVFCGLAEEVVEITFDQNIQIAAGDQAQIGIGVNSTTAFSGKIARADAGASSTGVKAHSLKALHTLLPTIGRNDITALENAASGTTIDAFLGGSDDMQLIARWKG
jgi:hypothetical protein